MGWDDDAAAAAAQGGFTDDGAQAMEIQTTTMAAAVARAVQGRALGQGGEGRGVEPVKQRGQCSRTGGFAAER